VFEFAVLEFVVFEFAVLEVVVFKFAVFESAVFEVRAADVMEQKELDEDVSGWAKSG
jgi:hypothetical protein